MIEFKQVDTSHLEQYNKIPMKVQVKSHYVLEKIDGGMGGILLQEVPENEYVKDLGSSAELSKINDLFDVSNWAFFMAFDGEKAVAGGTVASKTQGLKMLDGRNDLAVLWDIRVEDDYKRQGIGETIFKMAINWARKAGLKQLKIECQNNNVPAIRFYQKQGAVLCSIDEFAYYNDRDYGNEVQLIWYLDL